MFITLYVIWTQKKELDHFFNINLPWFFYFCIHWKAQTTVDYFSTARFSNRYLSQFEHDYMFYQMATRK